MNMNDKAMKLAVDCKLVSKGASGIYYFKLDAGIPEITNFYRRALEEGASLDMDVVLDSKIDNA